MKLYTISGGISEHPSSEHFKLHTHTDYEIYLFLEGDTKYIVEENIYSLAPGDVIIIRKNTMHRAFHNSCKRYNRIVINVQPEFFVAEGCAEYEKQFLLSAVNIGNKIDSEVSKKSGLYDAFMRINKYTNELKNVYNPVTKAIITEILYILNNINSFSPGNMGDERIKNIISYINNNFTKKLLLDNIEKKFYISKYHLCHIFPKYTGLTVHQYITIKRLAFAEDMLRNGMNKSQAAELAGFSHYTSFYRAYSGRYKALPDKNKTT